MVEAERTCPRCGVELHSWCPEVSLHVRNPKVVVWCSMCSWPAAPRHTYVGSRVLSVSFVSMPIAV